MSPGAAVTAWRCAVCGATVDIATAYPFRCPRATPEDRAHVLHPLVQRGHRASPPLSLDHPNPFVAYGPRMGWWAFATANGMSTEACVALAEDVAAEFAVTPIEPLDSSGIGGSVWAKIECGNVAGSHKGRHLAGILLHLRAAELLRLAPYGAARPPLAIASCGNAALAAATLAATTEWPLEVYVPEHASPRVLARLDALGAAVTTSPRRDDDPPGDPAVHRFREAVAAGAVPFSVQGPENGLCLDGGRTIGWEIADAVGTPAGPPRLDRVVVQVGGGALAACVGWGLGRDVRLDTLQAQGCAPLARAWWRASDAGIDLADPDSLNVVARRWGELMTPWIEPWSSADGILDDETYDWLADFAVMAMSGGRPLVAPEEAIVHAHGLAAATGRPVSATGAAGLAGLLVVEGRPRPDEHVAVILSGREL